jgi:hypothetical protein
MLAWIGRGYAAARFLDNHRTVRDSRRVLADSGVEMDPKSGSAERIAWLREKGAIIPDPRMVYISDDVELASISPEGLVLHPGCRIQGADTVMSTGVTLGAEGPVCVEDCCLGPGVELKGGYYRRSVFLEKVSMGWGAQVRESCLLEEEASGAHCVGLKQTILFPFVTLGSLVNFCDCLMAGGTSRLDHSEVGSSYVHFNFTPDGDKTTASLFGDVPRGVMLDRPGIFLGGQGGAVGPLRVEYGTVVAAGSILRRDVLVPGRLVSSPPAPAFERERSGMTYGNLTRVVRNNVLFLANLVALEEWYRKVRQRFFAGQERGEAIYLGALGVLARAKAERASRLVAMAEKVPTDQPRAREFRDRVESVPSLFDQPEVPSGPEEASFLAELGAGTPATSYVNTIRGFTPDVAALGVQWLEHIVDSAVQSAAALLPSFGLALDDR